jgi:hypothetical protein
MKLPKIIKKSDIYINENMGKYCNEKLIEAINEINSKVKNATTFPVHIFFTLNTYSNQQFLSEFDTLFQLINLINSAGWHCSIMREPWSDIAIRVSISDIKYIKPGFIKKYWYGVEVFNATN